MLLTKNSRLIYSSHKLLYQTHSLKREAYISTGNILPDPPYPSPPSRPTAADVTPALTPFRSRVNPVPNTRRKFQFNVSRYLTTPPSNLTIVTVTECCKACRHGFKSVLSCTVAAEQTWTNDLDFLTYSAAVVRIIRSGKSTFPLVCPYDVTCPRGLIPYNRI
ncbi:hypothetical protein CDAR_423381 [Caerostris darwini]|uniref:Uncharacterized protein n=1 Tax=Caerostris darwini TaxID=1538125 RepID=A0AAV4TPG2_9ARAC|nr:hypothetical protein CDAR_423381 [Caerostris darwini]